PLAAPTSTQLHTLSLHDALPIFDDEIERQAVAARGVLGRPAVRRAIERALAPRGPEVVEEARGVRRGRPAIGHGVIVVGSRIPQDRKSTRLNSSHDQISYAVFCS